MIVIGAVVTALAAPAAYSLDTATTAHLGAIPSAGPAATAGGPGGARPGGFGRGGGPAQGARAGGPGFGGVPGGVGIGPGGGFGGVTGSPGTRGLGGTAGGGRQQTGGGLLNAGTVSAALASALKADASTYRWIAGAVGAENASGYQLATSEPIMAIGGFNGTDPAPTLAEFESYVARGDIHYFIAGGAAGPGGGGTGQGSASDATQITQWVESHFTARTIGGTTVYDLTSSASPAAEGTSVTT